MNDGGGSADPYASEIGEIERAKSFTDIQNVLDRYSAVSDPSVSGGALYSGWSGGKPGSDFTQEFKQHSNTPLIDRTEFGKFLGDPGVSDAIETRAAQLFRERDGSTEAFAREQAGAYVYGKDAPGLTSNAESLWGQGSATFVKSLHGDVTVIATNAPGNRILSDVELEAALNNPNIAKLGDMPTAELRSEVAAAGGNYKAVLGEVQQSFRSQVAQGAFDKAGRLELSREFAEKNGFTDSANFPTAAELERTPGTAHLTVKDLPDYSKWVSPDLADGPSFVARPSGAAELPESAGLAGESGSISLGSAIRGAGIAGTVALGTYDAVKTAQQYNALQANGNSFAANEYLRSQAIVTASSVGGSIAGASAAGFAYGAAGGSETGPGAILTGLGGGLIGGAAAAIGGEKYAEHLTRESVDHDRGTDGKTYQYDNGKWETTHPVYEPWKSDSAAPASQVPKLDMERTEKLTDLAMANPTTIDPNKIQAQDPHTGETHTWQRAGAQEWTSSSHGAVTQASPELVAQLNQQSAMRTAMGTNSADVAAKGYVTDYYGNGWDKLGPMPQSVATQLHLPSETQVKDPATGITWDVNGNTVSRMATPGQSEPTPAAPAATAVPTAAQPGPVPPHASPAPAPGQPQPTLTPTPSPTQPGGQTSQAPSVQAAHPTPDPQPEQAPPQLVTATGATQARVLAARDQAVAANHQYGANLIQQQYDTMRATSPALAGNGQAATGPTVAPAAPQPGMTQTPSAMPSALSSALSSLSNDLSSLGDAIQSRLDTLRAAGVALPDVKSVQPYSPHTQSGSFVQLSDDVVAQHMGRGAYQVASVSQDLNGMTPPEGRNVTIDPRGQVAAPELTHSYQRMM